MQMMVLSMMFQLLYLSLNVEFSRKFDELQQILIFDYDLVCVDVKSTLVAVLEDRKLRDIVLIRFDQGTLATMNL